jgi:hypothetical protein
MLERINLNVEEYLRIVRDDQFPVRFIGFGGKLGAGKTYLAEALREYINAEAGKEVVVRYAFGDSLRNFIFNEISIPVHTYKHNMNPFDEGARSACKNLLLQHLNEYEFYYDLEFITKQLNECEIFNHAYRFILQYVGTEIYRMQESPDFWVDCFSHDVDSKFSEDQIIICDDVRFKNELDLITDAGLSVYAVSMKSNELLDQKKAFVVNHASETSLDISEFDLVYFNATDIQMDKMKRGKHLFNAIFPHILLYLGSRGHNAEKIFKELIISIDN